jgi:hypothetical protein
MKNKFLSLVLIFFVSVIAVSAQTKTKKLPVGSWKFEAPYAPEGYTTGKIKVASTTEKNTASMSFNGSQYELTGENVKVKADSVVFSVFLEGQDISVFLKVVDDTNMTGKAVYSEGEVPLTLKKIEENSK